MQHCSQYLYEYLMSMLTFYWEYYSFTLYIVFFFLFFKKSYILHLNNYACGCVTIDSSVAALQNCKNQVKLSNNNRVKVLLFSFQFVSLLLQRFLHFFSSVIREICFKETYFILRMIRHKRSHLNLCVTYMSPRGLSQTTHSHTHPRHPLTPGTRQNVTNSSCLYEFFSKSLQKTQKNIHLTTTKVQNPF